MKAKELFGLAVRLIGLLFLYQAISMVPTAIRSVFIPGFPHIYWSNVLPSLILVGWPLLAARWLIRGAPALQKLAYGREELSNPGTPEPAGIEPFQSLRRKPENG